MSGQSVSGFIGVVGLIAGYFLPTIIAAKRSHHNTNSITLLNLVLGWTVLGWLVALVWSVSATRAPEARPGSHMEIRREVLTGDGPALRKCPFCAEEIRFEAIKCRHCGSDVSTA